MSDTTFRPGAPYRLKADTLNGWQAAARAVRGGEAGADPVGAYERPRVIFAHNASATLVKVGQGMSITGHTWAPVRDGPSDDVQPGVSNLFQLRPVVEINNPTELRAGRSCIALDPIRPGEIGRVVVYGLVPAMVMKHNANDTRATLREGDRVPHTGHEGEFEIVYSEPGFSGDGDPGHGDEDEPRPLWAMLHLAPPPRHALTIRIGVATEWSVPETDPAETRKYRWVYDFDEAVLDVTPASTTIGTWIIKPGGINTLDYPEYRAVNLAEALHSDTTHTATEWWEKIPEGTIVRAWPERDSLGRTLWVFDEPTPQFLVGTITAASATTPTVASSVTYSVKIAGRDQTLTGVRPHWGTPVTSDGIIVPAPVGAKAIVVRADNGDGGLGWYLLIAEKVGVETC